MRLEKALGNTPTQAAEAKSYYEEEETSHAPVQRAAAPKEAPKASTPWDEDEDEDLSFFKKLADNN